MKKIFVVFTALFLFSTLSAGCNKKEKTCKKFYGKLTACMKELGIQKHIKDIGSEDKFVKECKKNFDEVQKTLNCISESDCKKFYKCAFGGIPAPSPLKSENIKANKSSIK